MMSSAAVSLVKTDLFRSHHFLLQARAEPGVMPRVLELFAKRGLVPAVWRSAVCGPDGNRLTIEIHTSGLPDEVAEYMAACMRQITSVEAVLTSVGAGTEAG